jgi:glycogen(starch) synthase
VEEYGERYCLIGPFMANAAAVEFEELPPPKPYAEALKKMVSQGVVLHFGRWLVPGNPHALLFELGKSWGRLEGWRAEYKEKTGIDCSPFDKETNDAIVFGFLVAWFLREVHQDIHQRKIIVQFHEWMAAVGLTMLKAWNIPIGSIFTTHATLIGRYLCAGQADFYHTMKFVNSDAEAATRGIYNRHIMEKRAAHDASVFTTVSDITAEEAEHLLHRRPDLVLPNGMHVEQFPVLHEFQNLHAKYKSRIHRFVRGHFFGNMDFDLDNTLYFFMGGRYEFQNKGIDMYIESLHLLNQRLKREGSSITIVAFIIAPSTTNGYNVETLKRQNMCRQLEETCELIRQRIGERLFDTAVRGQLPDMASLMDEEDLLALKRRLLTMRVTGASLPPIVTHNMVEDSTDPVLAYLRRRKLFNNPDDRVKIVFHPEFLSSTGLLELDYDQFVRGCHLGVFPSYYEPWGYTPAECVVRGVATITSNLSGFAQFMEKHVPDCNTRGVFVVDRRFKAPGESIDQMSTFMYDFAHLSRRDRVELRNQTERLSAMLDWRNLGRCYVEARTLALSRIKQ